MQFTTTLITLLSVLATASATPVVNARDAQATSTTAATASSTGPGALPSPTIGTYILGKCQNYEYDGYTNFCPTTPINPNDPEDYYVIECDPKAQCTNVDNACEWVVGNQYASCT